MIFLDKSNLLSDIIQFRTKVECGGQCLTEPTCEGFNFVNNICKLLKVEYLYKDGTEQTEVYISSSIAIGNNEFIKANL